LWLRLKSGWLGGEDFDLGEPFDPEPAAAGRGDSADGVAVPVFEDLAADVGGQEHFAGLGQREVAEVTGDSAQADETGAGLETGLVEQGLSGTPAQRWVLYQPVVQSIVAISSDCGKVANVA
jgi:hypothetical protein